MSGVSCQSNISQCSPNDRAVWEAFNALRDAHDQGRIPAHVTPNGRSQTEEMRARAGSGSTRELAKSVLGQLPAVAASKAATKGAMHLLERVGLSGASRALSVVAGVTTVAKISETVRDAAKADAKAIREAAHRDAMQVFVLEAVSAELPGFAAHRLRERGGNRGAADGVTLQLELKDSERLVGLRQRLALSAREGRDVAERLKLTESGALDRRLDTDAQLRSRYDSDTAFRYGVEHVVSRGAARR